MLSQRDFSAEVAPTGMDQPCIQVNLRAVLPLPAALVGTWLAGDHTLSYRFRADGSYERHLDLVRGGEACVARFHAWNRGSVRVLDDRRLVLVPLSGTVKSVDTCVAANNYERPDTLANEVLHYRRLTAPDGAPALLLRGPAGGERLFRHAV